jgi:ATP-dependent RNA helicase SUPV3L1/SUV3
MHKRFHLCTLKDQVWVADLIEPIQGLTISDRNTICSAPASQTDADLWRELMPAYARIIAEQSGGNLVDIPQLPLEVLDAEPSPSREYLRELERLHKGIVTYLWLSYRFAGLFSTRALAFHVKEMVEEKIEEVLSQFSFTEAQRRKIAAQREKSILKRINSAGVDAVDVEGRPAAEAVAGEDASAADDILAEQTTLTSGGDRFGGEEEFPFAEPGELDAEVEAELETEPEKVEAADSSFAAWRSEHTKEESQAPSAAEDAILETAHQEGEEAGRKEVQNKTLEDLSESEPTVEDLQPGIAAAAETTSSSDKAASPEQDPLDLDPATTLDADLPSDQPPVATQEVSPSATVEEGQNLEQAARKE